MDTDCVWDYIFWYKYLVGFVCQNAFLLWNSWVALPISWSKTFSTSPSQSTFLLGFPKMLPPSVEPRLLLLLLHEEPASKVSWNFGSAEPLLLLLLDLLELNMNEDPEEKLLLNPDETNGVCLLLFWLLKPDVFKLLLFHPCALELFWDHPWLLEELLEFVGELWSLVQLYICGVGDILYRDSNQLD